MKRMHCPLNGLRNISEFAYGGEVLDIPDSLSCSDREWAEYLFIDENRSDVVREWWIHTPSSYWFIAERNRSSNEIIKTYPAADVYSDEEQKA